MAENDLTNAAHVLKLAAECPTDTVCFHAQQCVEKYLKALLVLDGIDFPKTHDIERLTAGIVRRQTRESAGLFGPFIIRSEALCVRAFWRFGRHRPRARVGAGR